MFTRKITIGSLEDAKKFVNMTHKYDDINMHLRIDNYEIDAHSIVAVLSVVDSEKIITFTAEYPENDNHLSADIEPFLATEKH